VRTRTKIGATLAVIAFVTWNAAAQDAKPTYPSMAPLDQYLMERNAEIALQSRTVPRCTRIRSSPEPQFRNREVQEP
jgi:hypothetical protein